MSLLPPLDQLRLLYVCPVGVIGGAERILLDCVRAVRRHQPTWQVRVILFADGPLRTALEALGASVVVIELPAIAAASGDSQMLRPRSSTNPPKTSADGSWGWAKIAGSIGLVRFLWRLRQEIVRCKPDIIHSNGVKSHLCLALLPRLPGATVWHLHDFFSERPLVCRFIRPASRRATQFIAISQAIQQDFSSIVDRSDKRVTLIENSVDATRFTPPGADSQPPNGSTLDKLAGFDSKPGLIRVGLVATYAQWKGQDVFLRAMQRCPRIRGYIIGGPVYSTSGSQWTRDELVDLAAQLGLAERVGFVDFQADPAWVYRSLDVIVHASVRPEPFGLTIVEAMACGKAVVVARAGGAADLFTDGWDAVSHQPGDVVSLANAIDRLATNPEVRQVMGQHARQTATERFSFERFAEQLLRVYGQLL